MPKRLPEHVSWRRGYYRGWNRRSVFEYTLRIHYNASDEMKPLSLSLSLSSRFICLDKLRSHRPSPSPFRNRPPSPPRRRTPLIIHSSDEEVCSRFGLRYSRGQNAIAAFVEIIFETVRWIDGIFVGFNIYRGSFSMEGNLKIFLQEKARFDLCLFYLQRRENLISV